LIISAAQSEVRSRQGIFVPPFEKDCLTIGAYRPAT
jgi:hypothetical protein